MRNPVSVQATPRNSTVEAVDQKAISVERTRKSELLAHLIKDNQWFQVLVFTRTKHGANRLAEYLGKHGVTALAIHGNKSQNARTRALADFKRGDLQALVATDIAARGLDIEQLPHVVNFDLPNVPEDYVHRIGRTGRAGATGEAISLVSREEEALLRDIERLIKRPIPRMTVPSYQPSAGAAHDPDHRPARTAQPSRRPAAPKRPASQPQREARGRPQPGSGGRVKSPAQPGPAAKSRPGSSADARRTAAGGERNTAPAQPRSTPRPAAPRGGHRGSEGRDAGESLVRTNIPGFLQPTSRRGR
jgi:ATP-dependent RNA helicase RhlE